MRAIIYLTKLIEEEVGECEYDNESRSCGDGMCPQERITQ